MPAKAVAPNPWYLYLIRCRNGALYAGITPDVEARYEKHVNGNGAKYTRANPPSYLEGKRRFADKSSAARAEWAIRRLAPEGKLAFLRKRGPRAKP